MLQSLGRDWRVTDYELIDYDMTTGDKDMNKSDINVGDKVMAKILFTDEQEVTVVRKPPLGSWIVVKDNDNREHWVKSNKVRNVGQ